MSKQLKPISPSAKDAFFLVKAIIEAGGAFIDMGPGASVTRGIRKYSHQPIR